MFLLGHWKDYEELESSLSMQELTSTLNAIYKREERTNRFNAALQGVDLDSATSQEEDSAPATLQDIYARVQAKKSGRKVSAEEIEFAQIGTGYQLRGLDNG